MKIISNYASGNKTATFLGTNNEFIWRKLRTCTYSTSKNSLHAFIQQVLPRASIVILTHTARQFGKYSFDTIK